MLIQIKDGKPFGNPVSRSNFRMLYQNVSFPLDLNPEDVEPYGFALYEFSEPPKPQRYEKVQEIDPIKDDNGIYRQSYILVPMDENEKNSLDEQQSDYIRSQRNLKLLTTDWTQLPNSKVNSDIWEKYRDELRDITLQDGFPWNVTWPEEPSIS